LRQEEANVDVQKQEKLIQISLKGMSEKNKIQNRMNRDELKYKRALKALDVPPAPAPTTPAAVPDARELLTAYALQYGVMPSKPEEHGYDVNAFPPYAEPVVMDTAYRESTVGNTQTTTDASFFRQGPAFA